MSFHGGSQVNNNSPAIDMHSMMTSNLLVQRQLAGMRDELARTRRRCAELSEVEARKKGFELRCLGLERVVEELMAAVEELKVQTHAGAGRTRTGSTSKMSTEREQLDPEPHGLGINMDAPSTKGDSPLHSTEMNQQDLTHLSLQEIVITFIIASRRRYIPYQLRAIIRFLILQFQHNDIIDRVLGVGIIVVGAVLWTSLLVVQKFQVGIEWKTKKAVNAARRK